MPKPPDDLMKWPKGELAKEVQRLRAILHEHSERVGSDPRGASTSDPIIGGSPYGRSDAIIDARAAVLLEEDEVALVDLKSGPVALMLTLAGRVNYADDRVKHAYLTNGAGAAAIVADLIGIAARASKGDEPMVEYAADFKAWLERHLDEQPT